MKDGFNLKTLFPSSDDKNLQQYNYIGDQIILSVFTIFFCIVGLVGNGHIIWLLGFCIKRKPFAIYILNLAVADFGCLVILLPTHICLNPPSFDEYLEIPDVLVWSLISLLLLMYSISQLLLTAISIDRWLCVLFPNWYRCHLSPVLSTTVCAVIWSLSFLLIGVPLFLVLIDLIPNYYGIVITLCQAVSILICLLLVIISTLTLFIKVCFQSHRCQCGKLRKAILLMLLSFLLFTILVCASVIMFTHIALQYFGLWGSLKSSINPLIYFLVGRQNSGKFQERMKVILQRVFKEEKLTNMELQPCTEKSF